MNFKGSVSKAVLKSSGLFLKLLVGFIFFVPLVFAPGPSCAGKEEIKKHSFRKSETRKRTVTSRRRFHVVRKGETLYRIARRYSISVSSLKRLNNIRDVTDIAVGKRLAIPAKTAVTKRRGATSKRRTYARRGARRPRSSIRLIWPVRNIKISSRYGIRKSKKHDGLDLSGRKGTPIYAAASGNVIFSGWGPSGYGKIVIIKHSRNFITVYAHNSRNVVRKGQKVKQGFKVAEIGRTGRSTGHHVHFEVRVDRKTVNPERYLPRRKG